VYHLVAPHAHLNPLFFAFERIQPQQSVNVFLPNDSDLTPLALSVNGGNVELANHIIETRRLNLCTLNREREMVGDLVIRSGNVEWLKDLLARQGLGVHQIINKACISYNLTYLFLKSRMDMIIFLHENDLVLTDDHVCSFVGLALRLGSLVPCLARILAFSTVFDVDKIRSTVLSKHSQILQSRREPLTNNPALSVLEQVHLLRRSNLLSLVD
jgi:hypothetical protein